MPKGLLITESMSGWIELNNDQRRDFSFCIEAFNPKIFNLTGKRYFKGTAHISELGSYEINGILVIKITGPEYIFTLNLPDLGELVISGQKTYQLSKAIYSMTHCPLRVSINGKPLGVALLAYKDSILSFPFKALSITEKPSWYDEIAYHSFAY